MWISFPVTGDEIRWKFTSDGSVNGWGWRLTVFPLMPCAAPETCTVTAGCSPAHLWACPCACWIPCCPCAHRLPFCPAWLPLLLSVLSFPPLVSFQRPPIALPSYLYDREKIIVEQKVS